jgi:hypothetical protein
VIDRVSILSDPAIVSQLKTRFVPVAVFKHTPPRIEAGRSQAASGAEGPDA